MQCIDEVTISHKTVLVRVDYNVSLNPDHTIANDERIRQSLPTLTALIKNGNRLVLLSHLGQPKGADPAFSLKDVAERIRSFLPDSPLTFLTSLPATKDRLPNTPLVLLENLRFFPGEKANDLGFAKQLSRLGESYVNDAFSVCHRADATIVTLPTLLPAYAGLLLKKEITMLTKLLHEPPKPVVAILGGAKISTKIQLLDRLMHLADYVIVGGGLANTFLKAQNVPIGRSLYEADAVTIAQRFLSQQHEIKTEIVLPKDVVVANTLAATTEAVKPVTAVTEEELILDIGPETQAHLGSIIAQARTIIWNGPVGYFENPVFRRGTDFLYYAITENPRALSIVGGGETLAAIAKKEYLEKITHISTGGGAMLAFIEKGTLPGIQALR